MKKNKKRLKTEKDSNQLEKKIKMLQTEEMKAYKKFTKEKKFQEEWDGARQRNLDFKNELNHSKFQKKAGNLMKIARKLKVIEWQKNNAIPKTID